MVAAAYHGGVIVRESIDVAAPTERAFAYVADFTTTAEWDPGIASSVRVSGDGGIGTEYDVVALFRGKQVPFRYRVTEHEPGRRIVLVGEGKNASSTDTIAFSASGEGTRIDYEAEFRLKGLLALAAPFLGGTFRDLAAKALAGLQAQLDRPAA